MGTRLFRLLDRISRWRLLACLLVAGLPMCIRLAALRIDPIPEPQIQDEYAYLLAADTFCSGRLTNPTPPMWVHFETFHENFQPTYMSKYPPFQSVFMAVGQRFLKHPWYGVWLSFGFMCACLCWMLQGWMPPVYALLGTVVAIGQLGIFGYWMDSYWGGAVTASGGCLMLGALPRLARRASAGTAALGALGVMILANSRPFEGFITALAAGSALLWWRRRRRRPLSELLRPTVLAPVMLICAAGFLWMGYYNYRGTGSPFVMPYVVNNRLYAANPQFYLLPPGPIPTYRHEALRRIWVDWTRGLFLQVRHNPLNIFRSFTRSMRFYFSALMSFAIFGGIFVARSLKVRVAVSIMAALVAAMLLEAGLQAHYFAPAMGLLFVPAMYGVRWLRVRALRFGPTLVLLFATCIFVQGMYALVREGRLTGISRRQQVINQLTARGGRHLVIVRYSSDHYIHGELVFNTANIDASAVIWARDMGEEKNRELVDYYRDRHVWLLEPDATPSALQPYARVSVR
jgi:hypothetical protein